MTVAKPILGTLCAFLTVAPVAFSMASSVGVRGAQACQQIHKAYNQCQSHSQLDPATGDFVFPSGQKLTCSDGQPLQFYQRLLQMDVASILLYPYPLDIASTPLTMNGDPGRLRVDTLFRATYGRDINEVQKNLISVPFLGSKVSFNRKNGAAAAFNKVGQLLEAEAAKNSYVAQFLQPWLSGRLVAGTFNWRLVAGTNRLSAHSFATAVDINNPDEKKNVYWLWDWAKQKRLALQAQGIKKSSAEIIANINEELESNFVPQNLAEVPLRVIQIFESQGFIWGGKWYHYDSMHFEYRPEFFPGSTADCSRE